MGELEAGRYIMSTYTPLMSAFMPCEQVLPGTHWEKYMWWFSPLVVIFVANSTTSANHHMYLWWFSPQVQITTSTCGDFVQGWVNG